MEPECGPTWSALATLHCQMYTFDAPGFDRPLETALEDAPRGVLLEPGPQLGRLILAYACERADDSDRFDEEIGTALALNPNSPYTVGTAGYLHVVSGDFERGLPLLDSAIAANPCHPSWFHGAYVVDCLHQQNCEDAVIEVQRHSPFQSFWLPVASAAILAKLGRIDEAKTYIEDVVAHKPDCAARAHELMWRTLKVDAVIDDLIGGLRSAGLSG